MERRRALIDRRHPSLSLTRQCRLLDISRSGLYYQLAGVSQEALTLMKLIDRQYLAMSFDGARRMVVWLGNHKYGVNRKRVRRLVRTMEFNNIYRRPGASQHQVTKSTPTC